MCTGHIYHNSKLNPNTNMNDVLLLKVSKGAKISSRYNQVPHPTQHTNWKVTNSQLDTTNESQEVSPFPAGDHKAHINRHAQRHSKHKTEQKHKRSTKEVPKKCETQIWLAKNVFWASIWRFLFLFYFLGNTIIMTPSVQINSFLNDFRLFFYIRTLF